MPKEKSRDVKKRNWAFVLYPESAMEDWREQLQQTGLQCAISPLHDKDLNADEKEKKPHWHVIVCYSGPTSYSVVSKLTEKLNATIPQPLEQIRGYYRYFTHKDNPEKYQYDKKEIKTINGFNILDYVELTKSEVNEIKLRLQALIRDLMIYEYCDLLDYLMDNSLSNEYDVASGHTFLFDRYITSRRHKVQEENAKQFSRSDRDE